VRLDSLAGQALCDNFAMKLIVSAVLAAAIVSIVSEASFGQPLPSCKVETLSIDALKITSQNDGSELIVLGHTHRAYWALDKFAEMIEDAAKSSGDRVELAKKLDAIRAWNGNDVQTYYKNYSGPTYEHLRKLVHDNKIDFVGIESPYVTVGNRIPKIKAAAELYAKLATEAYGSAYADQQLEKDLLGMFATDYYFASTNPNKLKIEGVESSLLEYRHGATYTALAEALTKVDAAKTDQNKKTVDTIVGLLGMTSLMNESVLALAKGALSPEIYKEAEKAALLRKKFEEGVELRESWMLQSMKSRSQHTGLLIVGTDHLINMKSSPAEFCKALKPQSSPTSPPGSVH